MNRRPRASCVWPECTTQRGRLTEYCAVHVRVAKQCSFDDCKTRVAYWNREKLCSEHRWLASK